MSQGPSWARGEKWEYFCGAGWLPRSAVTKGRKTLAQNVSSPIPVLIPSLVCTYVLCWHHDNFRWTWLNALKGMKLVIPFPISPPSPPKTSTTGLLQNLMSDSEDVYNKITNSATNKKSPCACCTEQRHLAWSLLAAAHPLSSPETPGNFVILIQKLPGVLEARFAFKNSVFPKQNCRTLVSLMLFEAPF